MVDSRPMRRHGVVLLSLLLAALAGCHPDSGPVTAPTTATGHPTATATGQPSPTATPCPPGSVLAQLFPVDRARVKVRVLNGGISAGTARAVATQFRDWQMQVVAVGTAALPYVGLVLLRYGPRTIGAAWTLRPFFMVPDRASWKWTGRDDFQLDRANDIVDVVLGTRFQQLNTTTEVNQATAGLGLPA